MIEHQPRRHGAQLADGAGAGTVGLESAGVDGVHVCGLVPVAPIAVSGAATVAVSHQQPALIPSAIDGVAEQSTVCFTAGGQVNGHTQPQLESAALHHHAQHAQQPHHHRRPSNGADAAHFHPQLGRGATANGSSKSCNANGTISGDAGQGHGTAGGVRLQLGQQQHAAALAPDDPSTAAANGAAHSHSTVVQGHVAGLAGLPSCAASSSAATGSVHQSSLPHSDFWVNVRSQYSDSHHLRSSGNSGSGSDLMPYLDAASRSSGLASTSSAGSSRYSSPSTRGSTGGRGPVPAAAHVMSAAAAAAAATALTTAGAGVDAGAGPAAGARVPLELAERVAAAAADAASQEPGWVPSGAGSGSGRNSNGNSKPGVTGGSAAAGSNGNGRKPGNAGLSPWHPDAELLSPSTLHQRPEGDEHYAAFEDDAEDLEGEEDEDGADRPGRRRRGRRSSTSSNGDGDPLEVPRPRQPRHPSRAEHRMLRQQAVVRQLALRPRAPAPEDLRLTSRIMTTTHWSQLLPLLADHAEVHERRQRQQLHSQQSSKGAGGSRALSPGARSGATNSGSDSGSGSGKGAAGLNALAAAAAVASSGHVPMGALPYTPQHVAAALQRTAQLVEHGAGPGSASEARRLHGLVDCLARLAAALLPSPGMGLREISGVFHSLVRWVQRVVF